MAEVGIRELRNHLSAFLDRVRAGEEVVVTDRGTPVARLLPVGRDSAYDRLVREGLVAPAKATSRSRPRRREEPSAPISDLVAGQRR